MSGVPPGASTAGNSNPTFNRQFMASEKSRSPAESDGQARANKDNELVNAYEHLR
jgi:hypothetical protein